MEYAAALGVWAILIAAPCTISLLVGDIFGASRMRRLYESTDLLSAKRVTGDLDQNALEVDAWRLDTSSPASRISAFHEESPDPGIELEHRRRRREAFATMPPLEDIRAEADAIRLTHSSTVRAVWDSPELDRREPMRQPDPAPQPVLDHYGESIRKLQLLSGALCPKATDQACRTAMRNAIADPISSGEQIDH